MLHEHLYCDGGLRLKLVVELDLSAESVDRRLRKLLELGCHVRLDLARLGKGWRSSLLLAPL